MTGELRPAHLIAGAVVLGALLYAMRGNAGAVGTGIATAAVEAVTGAFVGTVEAVGEQVGIPKTNREKGQEALERGDWWEASFLLPAPDFIGAAWDRVTK